jgi:hypothetical protein
MLITTSKSNDERMVQLHDQVKELGQMVVKLSLPDTRSKLGDLLSISEDAYTILLSQKVVSTLRFGDMNTRFDIVPQALKDTYQWIFDDKLNADNRYLRRDQLGQSLNTWLSSGDGIFHISGKFGSGKSTLMKLVSQDNRTRERLMEWAGDSQLIIAKFFFWKPGSRLQKSWEGLFRSLLYESLKVAPKLVEKVLPKQWEEIKSSPVQQPDDNFSLQDLQDAFERLREIEGYRICYFIDGLDEYEKTANADYVDMAKKLYQWSESGRNIKLCVSSRQDNHFINRFPENQRIYMQDLNAPDIQRFIDDKLDFKEKLDTQQQQELDVLKTKVSDKSAGLFLWVALVIGQLCEMHEDGKDTKAMIKEVDEIPAEIEETFKHILRSIRGFNRTRAYRTFTTIRKWNEYREKEDTDLLFPLGTYYFIDHCSTELSDERAIPILLEKWEQKPEENRLVEARKMLMGSCRGLLEPIEYGSDMLEHRQWVVDFTQRSVPEFLQSHQFQEREGCLKDFCVENTISRLLLTHIWDKSNSDFPRKPEWISLVTYNMMKFRHENKVSKEPFFLENRLESALVKCEEMHDEESDNYNTICISKKTNSPYFIGCINSGGSKTLYLCNSLHIAAWVGNSAYVRWKLSQDPSCIESPLDKAILAYCITKAGIVLCYESLTFDILTTFTSACPQIYLDCAFSNVGLEFRIWQHLLFNDIARIANSIKIMQEEGTFEGKCQSFRKTTILWEKLLESGVDAHFTMSLSPQKTGGRNDVRLVLERRERQVDLAIGEKSNIEHLFRYFMEYYKKSEITLIDLFSLLPDNEKLLSLVKCKSCCLSTSNGESSPIIEPNEEKNEKHENPESSDSLEEIPTTIRPTITPSIARPAPSITTTAPSIARSALSITRETSSSSSTKTPISIRPTPSTRATPSTRPAPSIIRSPSPIIRATPSTTRPPSSSSSSSSSW